MEKNLQKGLIECVLAVVGVGVGTSLFYNNRRKKRQEELQEHVKKSLPASDSGHPAVYDQNIQLSVLEDQNIDLSKYQVSPMSDAEINEWKSLISTFGGETTKAILTASAFNGLLRCDVPLKDLCRMKNNPDVMRGMIINNGKISKHASFSEANFSNMAPLFAYQCMAAITSQYYQQIITEQLNSINCKLDTLLDIDLKEDKAKIKVSYHRFVELSQKNNYDIADKVIASEFSGYADLIKEKYRELLLNIETKLDTKSKWSNKKEANEKVDALRNSRYFEYLEMAMQAELLSFIATAITIKIARSLGNEEDAKIYTNRMNFDYWDNYIDQFNRIKHSIISYIDEETKDALMQEKSITSLKDKQIKLFNEVEKSIMNLQEPFESSIVQYIKVTDDGELVKYISVSKE